MAQSRSKINAFFYEFSWLSSHVNPKNVQECYVHRIDQDILNRQPRRHDIGFLDTRWVYESIKLLDVDGEVVVNPDQEQVKRAWCKPWTWKSKINFSGQIMTWETVEAGLKRLGAGRRDVKYLLSVYQGVVVIYKLPRNFDDIDSWLESQVQKAQSDLREEIEKIDNVQ